MNRRERRTVQKTLASHGIARGTQYFKAGAILFGCLLRPRGEEIDPNWLKECKIAPEEAQTFAENLKDLSEYLISEPSELQNPGVLLLCIKVGLRELTFNPETKTFSSPAITEEEELSATFEKFLNAIPEKKEDQ